MANKRKPSKPKRLAEKRARQAVRVRPVGLGVAGWKVVMPEGTVRILAKPDAVLVGRLAQRVLVHDGYSVSLYIHGRTGKVQEERTLPRSADPKETPG